MRPDSAGGDSAGQLREDNGDWRVIKMNADGRSIASSNIRYILSRRRATTSKAGAKLLEGVYKLLEGVI